MPLASRLPYIRRRHGWQYDRQNGDILASSPHQPKRYRASGHSSARGNASFTKGAQPLLSARGLLMAVVDEVGGECLSGIIPSLWLLIAGWEDVHSQVVPETFWRTLVADQGLTSDRAPGWYRRACELSFRESPNPFFDTKSLQRCVDSSPRYRISTEGPGHDMVSKPRKRKDHHTRRDVESSYPLPMPWRNEARRSTLHTVPGSASRSSSGCKVHTMCSWVNALPTD